MKSVIKVSSKVIAIKGSARLTDFRIASFKEKFQSSTFIDLKELNCNEIYFAILRNPNKIKDLKLSKEAREKCKTEIKKLKNMSPMSAEATVIRNYLDWITSIPWSNPSTISKNINNAKNIIEEDKYG